MGFSYSAMDGFSLTLASPQIIMSKTWILGKNKKLKLALDILKVLWIYHYSYFKIIKYYYKVYYYNIL